jgi:hypothetical protein
MPHAIHAGFSLVSSVLFFVVALLLVVADHELEPLSHSLLAAPHSMTELRMLLAKTVITVADILLRPAPHIQVSLYAAACLLMLWFQLRWVSAPVPGFRSKEGKSLSGAFCAHTSNAACMHTKGRMCTQDHKPHTLPRTFSARRRRTSVPGSTAFVPVSMRSWRGSASR